LPQSDAYSASTSLYDEEEEEEEEEEGEEAAEDEGYDEEEEEEGEDETAGGGFASLAGTRITRDVEAPADSDDEWDEAGEHGGGAQGAGQGPYAGEEDGADALELTTEAAEPETTGPQNELLLDADRVAEADQGPLAGRRRRLLGGGADEPQGADSPPKSSGGSTLFERMANLSRAGTESSDEEEEEGEGSSSLRIPRFLGRQNNQ
jgi:cell division protein FtsZ